jgi:hypothetical protein
MATLLVKRVPVAKEDCQLPDAIDAYVNISKTQIFDHCVTNQCLYCCYLSGGYPIFVSKNFVAI